MEKFWTDSTTHWEQSILTDRLNDRAFHLICLVGASKSIPDQWAKNRNEKSMFGALFESEIRGALSEAILSLAICFRTTVDFHATDYVDSRMPSIGEISSGGHKTELYPREACNKIIHATSIEFECEIEGDERPTFNRTHNLHRYTGMIRLMGVMNKKDWAVRLDMMKLCDSAILINSGHWQWLAAGSNRG